MEKLKTLSCTTLSELHQYYYVHNVESSLNRHPTRSLHAVFWIHKVCFVKRIQIKQLHEQLSKLILLINGTSVVSAISIPTHVN